MPAEIHAALKRAPTHVHHATFWCLHMLLTSEELDQAITCSIGSKQAKALSPMHTQTDAVDHHLLPAAQSCQNTQAAEATLLGEQQGLPSR